MEKSYTFKCQSCGKVETLKYKTYFYRIKYGSGKCNSCSKKGGNQTSFKKGRTSLNKGKKSKLCKEKHWNWKGGITPLIIKIRRSFEYKLWRTRVFERDNYTCILCNARNGNGKKIILNADHYPKSFSKIIKEYNIKSYNDAMFCSELWDINNGRTLCRSCHLEETSNYQKLNWVNQYENISTNAK